MSTTDQLYERYIKAADAPGFYDAGADCTCVKPVPGDGTYRCPICGHRFRIGEHDE